MTTSWVNARNISQYAETGATDIHIRWKDDNSFSGLRTSAGSPVTTEKELFHIARSPKPNITNKTYFLQLTNFNFDSIPTIINGIECRIESRRFGRITDDTINLVLNNELIGNNQAQLSVNPLIHYGGDNNIWGLSSITSDMINNSSFGLLVRFRSHPNFPHSDGMHLISIQLRIH